MSERDSGRDCTTCGAQVSDDDVICGACGSVLARPAAAATPATPPGTPVTSSDPTAPTSPGGSTPTAGPGAPPPGFAGGPPPGGPLSGARGRGRAPGTGPAGPGGFTGAVPPVAGPPPTTPAFTPAPSFTPTPPPKASQGKRLLVICGVGAVLALGLFAVMSIVAKDDGTETVADDDERDGDKAGTSATPPPTTPRNEQEDVLDRYCAAPTAWPEVPAHDPAVPSQVYIVPDGSGLNENGVTWGDGNGQVGPPDGTDAAYTNGPRPGATAVSPKPDGVELFTDQIADVRTVACVDFVELRGTGQQCSYSGSGTQNLFDESSHELASSVWAVSVYELHSGKKVSGGEIQSRSDVCPGFIQVATPDEQVHYSVTNQDIVNWLGTKFPDGVPQP